MLEELRLLHQWKLQDADAPFTSPIVPSVEPYAFSFFFLLLIFLLLPLLLLLLLLISFFFFFYYYLYTLLLLLLLLLLLFLLLKKHTRPFCKDAFRPHHPIRILLTHCFLCILFFFVFFLYAHLLSHTHARAPAFNAHQNAYIANHSY